MSSAKSVKSSSGIASAIPESSVFFRVYLVFDAGAELPNMPERRETKLPFGCSTCGLGFYSGIGANFGCSAGFGLLSTTGCAVGVAVAAFFFAAASYN